jgi:hypothetical protein
MLPYGRLTPALKEKLDSIVPSVDDETKFYPCRAVLDDGTVVERVMLVSAMPFLHRWTERIGDDRLVRVERLGSIEESPSRLPPEFATGLYASHLARDLGHVAFTVFFGNGSSETFMNSYVVDFIEYPVGTTSRDVVRVVPDSGKGRTPRWVPTYSWCLYT